MPNLRLIPVVVFAAFCLLVLKTIGFIAGGESGASPWRLESEVWTRLAGSAPDGDVEITGSAHQARPAPAIQHPAARQMAAPPPTAPAAEAPSGSSPAERAIIERLQERRQELEARARDLEMRENLLKAAEQRLESRIEELKELEGKGGEPSARLKSIVVMYEAMRPKEAARIFDRLDSRLLVEVVNHMNPRKVSEILAQMQPESAERLTLELARRRSAERALPSTDLPRIGDN